MLIRPLPPCVRKKGFPGSKLKLEREKRNIETNRNEAWKEYEQAAREIEKRKDSLIDEVEKKLAQQLTQKELFTIRWRLH
jgi:hypothetical protein